MFLSDGILVYSALLFMFFVGEAVGDAYVFLHDFFMGRKVPKRVLTTKRGLLALKSVGFWARA